MDLGRGRNGVVGKEEQLGEEHLTGYDLTSGKDLHALLGEGFSARRSSV